MNVVPIQAIKGFSSVPIIAFVDLQVEHISPERACSVKIFDPWMGNCKRLLDEVREMRLPVSHFRQIRSEVYFNRVTDHSRWIDEFQPRVSESIYERELPSCYSNPAFSKYIDQINQPTLVLAGLTADQACLSTIIEAYHRNHKVIYIHDASANPALETLSEEESHEFVCSVISLYAKISTTDEVLNEFRSMNSATLRGFS